MLWLADRRPLEIWVILFGVRAFLREMSRFATIITRTIVVLRSGMTNVWGNRLAWCCKDRNRSRVNLLPRCWRYLSIKYKYQINKEKDPNATDIQTLGFIWQNSTSFGVCLFLQGVIRKYGRKAHMSGLHRDINVPRNYLTSKRVQKPQERTGYRTGSGAGRPPRPRGQSEPTSRIVLHRPKASRITVQSMSVWSDGPHSLGRTI